MTNIAIGQYFPVKSYVHSLDPRVKLVSTICFIALLFVISSPISYLLTILFLAVAVIMSKVPFSFIFRGVRGILFIMLFSVVLNVFLTTGETVLYKAGIFTITMEGVEIASKMAIRLVLLVLFSSLMTLTTTPIALTDAIEYLLKPLKAIGVPAHEIAMMMTIALRFIPTLLEETHKIMQAQMARGADFDTGGLIKKAKSLIPLLVPLFVSAFRRADELALAMEARCYRGDIKRTRMKVLKLQKIDYFAIIFLILFFGVCVFINLGNIFTN